MKTNKYMREIKPGEFKCPECGSNRFGTSNCLAKNPADMIGHCHGAGCRFTWSRADDKKYFSERGE